MRAAQHMTIRIQEYKGRTMELEVVYAESRIERNHQQNKLATGVAGRSFWKGACVRCFSATVSMSPCSHGRQL